MKNNLLDMKTLSSETCKAIEALGVTGETYFYWWHVKDGEKEYNAIFYGQISCGEPIEYIAPAYTFSELLDILPQLGRALKWQKATYIGVPLKMLDAYLTGGMEDVDKEMQKLLASK